MSKAYVEIPGKVWLAVIAGSFLGLLSRNSYLTVASLMVLPFLIFPLWRKGEPPILSFLLFFQWLEVTLKLFNADMAGVPVEGVIKVGKSVYATYFYTKEASKAIWLGLGALVSLAVGMRLGMSRFHKQSNQGEIEVPPFSIQKLFTFYIFAFLISSLSNYFVWRFISISQFLLALVGIKWAILYLLVYRILQRRSGYGFLLIVLFLEIGSGFIAYFAQFKGVIYIATLAFLTLHFRMRMRHIVIGLLILSLALYLGAVWSVVKKDFRTFIRESTQEGTKVSSGARIEKMSTLLSGFNRERMRQGFKDLTERIAYIDFFAQVIEHVPGRLPYEEGRLWKVAINHILTPRIFFPNKPDLPPDSDITRKYAGIRVAGGSLGGETSIGIGYFAESYVDFGPKFMFIPIFLLGLLESLIYRYFIYKSKVKIIGSAASVAVLIFSASSMASSSAKVLGGVLTNFIVFALILTLFERRFVRQLSAKFHARIVSH